MLEVKSNYYVISYDSARILPAIYRETNLVLLRVTIQVIEGAAFIDNSKYITIYHQPDEEIPGAFYYDLEFLKNLSDEDRTHLALLGIETNLEDRPEYIFAIEKALEDGVSTVQHPPREIQIFPITK